MGLTVAYQYALKHPRQKLLIIEKESSEAEHSSGRNSSVIHSGFYYNSTSLKAKYCVECNRLLKLFCKDIK